MTKPGETTKQPGSPTVDAVVRALLIKGFVTPDGLAPALQTTEEEAGSALDQITADGLAELTGGMFKLTAEGQSLGNELITADRERWGMDNAVEGLDAFLPLDQRTKDIVTAWQMREVDGEPVLNDHADPVYDASVLAELDSLHQDAIAWLRPLSDGLPRLDVYFARLERAATLIADGDHSYIASPRVDSYHTIWFEFHEDLILLAGRTRGDEVATGRA